MKIAVFGSNGMAGHVITKYLRNSGFDVVTVARTGADINCNIEIQGGLDAVLPRLADCSYVINCIGLLVKDSIERPDRAALINGWFPHYLEWWARDKDTRIVHLSTDCVFDGSVGWYKEGATHTETNAYGKSKSYGELDNGKDITFRMSIIGPELKNSGTGLLNWVLNNKEDTLPGYVDAWWNGITTLQLAKCIHTYIDNPCVSGVYHLVNNGNYVNKFDLLCLINKVYNLGKNVVPANGPKLVNKILVDTKVALDWKIPEYKVQLTELKDFS